MQTVTIQEAQTRLVEIIRRMKPGEEVLIVSDQEPVAALVSRGRQTRKARVPGTERDAIVSMTEDFDAPLEDFAEYMR